MRTEIHDLNIDAALSYSEVLSEAVKALPASIEHAATVLGPIAGEVWMGRLSLHGATSAGSADRGTRQFSEKTKAEVFMRDRFLCTFCGYPTVPRCILVAISDVFPDVIPYYAHYRRGSVHPVYWALAPEADHIVAHASGGSNDVEKPHDTACVVQHAKVQSRCRRYPCPREPPDELRNVGWTPLELRGHRHCRRVSWPASLLDQLSPQMAPRFWTFGGPGPRAPEHRSDGMSTCARIAAE